VLAALLCQTPAATEPTVVIGAKDRKHSHDLFWRARAERERVERERIRREDEEIVIL
jgi:hypothetical protein